MQRSLTSTRWHHATETATGETDFGTLDVRDGPRTLRYAVRIPRDAIASFETRRQGKL
jgi:hypothetical protein